MALTQQQLDEWTEKQKVTILDSRPNMHDGLYILGNGRVVHGSDILLDLTTDQPAGRIFDWSDKAVDIMIEGIEPELTYKEYLDGMED